MNSSTASAGASTAPPSCSNRFPVIPVRYAVVPRRANEYAYTGNGHVLEQSFPALKSATYTLRALRPGYVYVWMTGPQGETLTIHEHDGEGNYRPLLYRHAKDYDKLNSYKTGKPASSVWVDACATEAWIGYSQHLWTNATTAKVTENADFRRRLMQQLDLKDLTNGDKAPSRQRHVLTVAALTQWVEDFKPDGQRPNLKWSSHYHPVHTRAALLEALGAGFPKTKPRVPAVVALFDPEGIALDLGLIANANRFQLMDLMNPSLDAKSDPSDVPPALKLDVETLHVASATFQRKQLLATLIDQTLEGLFYANGSTHGSPDNLARLRAESHRNRPAGHRQPSHDELRLQVLTEERMSPAGARFASRMNLDEYKAFLKQRAQAEQQMKVLLKELDRACADHDSWLATAEHSHTHTPHSLAAVLSAYDRDNLLSANGLEQSLALIMHGMGLPLPGRHNEDPRFKRLSRWLDDPASPLFVALAAYNPFREKADAMGSLLGAGGDLIEELGGKFPAVVGATDLIAENVTATVLQRIQGQTRWSSSNTLRAHVLAAAAEARADRVLGLLGARYRVTDSAVTANALSQEVQAFVNSGMAEVHATSTVSVSGTRQVTVQESKTLRVSPKLSTLGKAGGIAALDTGMVVFNIVFLYDQAMKLNKQYSHANAINFTVSLLGLVGALGSGFASTRNAYAMVLARSGVRLPGIAFTSGIIRVVSATLFSRITGWPGIVWGMWSDFAKAIRLSGSGSKRGAAYTASAAFAVTLGSFALLETSLVAGLVGTATGGAFVPGPGWVLAIGCLLVAGGTFLYTLAGGENHIPIELWVTRSIFGNRMGDGNDSTPRAADGRPPAYVDVMEELKGWYQARFAPQLLTSSQAKAVGWSGADSQWHENYGYPDTAEFTVLLPGYLMGQSLWGGGLRLPNPVRPGELPLAPTLLIKEPAVRVAGAGLLLRYRNDMPDHRDRIFLDITYRPSQGFDETAEVTTSFALEDGWFE